jgi:nucleotide-binding universal stress UspA family protein
MLEQPSDNQVQPQPSLSEGVSFAKILVATDFSRASDRALEYALSLARSYDSRILLTHVIPVDLLMRAELAAAPRDEMRQAARGEMDRIESSGSFFGVAHEEIIEEGTLWPKLEKLIEDHEIDLVVVGTHGKGPSRKLVIGSSAEEIFRHSRVPVLTVGPQVEREPLYGVELRNILLATDLGIGSERQAAYAFTLAQEHCSRITLLHVEEREEDVERTVRRLKALVPSEADLRCLPLFRIERGDPVSEIQRIAAEIHTDLMVLGAKAPERLSPHVNCTKAYQVICSASCPVLTIKS